MAVRSTINQKVQIGIESVHGTAVACNKVLSSYIWTLGAKPTTKQFRGSGRQYPGTSALLWKEGSFKAAGPGDFGENTYMFSLLWGAPTSALDGASSTVYTNTWTPPLTGSYASTVKSATLQMGETTGEQYTYNVMTGFGYKINRKQEISFDFEGINQGFTTGVSLTASPTEVPQNPMTGAQANVYLDPTSGAVGTTLISSDMMEAEFKAADYFAGYYPVNRTNTSFADLIDKEKKHDFTMTLQASATALAYIATYNDTGAKAYFKVDALGPVIDAGHSLNAEFSHEMCAFMTGYEPFSDSDGVYAYKTMWCLAEDTAWGSGQAQIIVLTNLLNGLA